MKKYTLKLYSRNAANFIWLLLLGYSIENFSIPISISLFLIPVLIVFIRNFFMYGDFNIFKDDLDRSIIFLEKRLNEIKNSKSHLNNEKN
jgi:hypothetical protein